MLGCRFLHEPRSRLARTLEGISWGLGLLWIGIVILSGWSGETAFLGLGIVILATQYARRALGLRLEGFWLVVGTLFVVGTAWELFDVRFPLSAVVLIVAGTALVIGSLRPARRHSKG